MRIIKDIYLTSRFFILAGIVIAVVLFSYSLPILFIAAQVLLILLLAFTLLDIFLLFSNSVKIDCNRTHSSIFSLGSDNPVAITIKIKSPQKLQLTLIDEVPDQIQNRDFKIQFELESNQSKKIEYTIHPKVRGEFHFGYIRLFIKSSLGIIQRRISFPQTEMVPVYPSIIEMKKLELNAFPRTANFDGIKKIRRLGHSYEFDQIKNYAIGDDFRSINWKATGRKGGLMVNQYEDEKAQQIYSVIDTSRVMKMPFNQMSLLDYAINTSLVISNIALHKQDKAGLITFGEKVNTVLRAERSRAQLKKIIEVLYNQEENSNEANYEALYLGIKNLVKGRSLLMLYTNFESYYALERILPILRKINKTHLLVIVFFENSEILDYAQITAKNVEEVYYQTIAQKFIIEKSKIINELKQFGIQTIYTKPEDLSINTINKYLELKSRGLI